MTNKKHQTSDFPVLYQLDSDLPGGQPKLVLRFPLRTLDVRRRYFEGDSFIGGFQGKRPQLLWSHDMWELPFGSLAEVVVEGDFLVGRAILADTQKAREIFSLLSLEPPAIQSMSIGWMSDDQQTVTWEDGQKAFKQKNVILMDMSLVNFGGMKGTRVEANAMGDDRAVPTHDGRTKDTPSWDGDAAVERLKVWASDGDEVDFAKFEQGFAVVEGDPENLGSYHFPHHDVDADGLFVSKAGLVAAWAAAKGARSGEANEAALTHLKPHREQFNLGEGNLLTRWIGASTKISRLVGGNAENLERKD